MGPVQLMFRPRAIEEAQGAVLPVMGLPWEVCPGPGTVPGAPMVGWEGFLMGQQGPTFPMVIRRSLFIWVLEVLAVGVAIMPVETAVGL